MDEHGADRDPALGEPLFRFGDGNIEITGQ